MSTVAQQQANKENAKHSTGPRTAEGKQRSSCNAIKHGFRAKDPLIPGENRDDFNEHAVELEFYFNPANAFEKNLVEQIIDVTWRLKRCARLESALIAELFDNAAEQPANQDKGGEQLLGQALAHDSRLAVLNRLDRHESTLTRRYNSAMKLLQDARQRRAGGLLFSGISTALRAKPAAESAVEPNTAADPVRDTDSESEMTDLTQSVTTLLESIAPMKNENGDRDPSDMPIAEALQFYAETPEQVANQEAAK